MVLLLKSIKTLESNVRNPETMAPLLLLLLLLLLLQVIPVKVNYDYFTLYKASSLTLKTRVSKR